MTYKEQFNKLTEAYISGKVNPLECGECFVGNLLNGNRDWRTDIGMFGHVHDNPIHLIMTIKKEAEGFYTPQEIADLEEVFCSTINRSCPTELTTCSNIALRVRHSIALSDAQEEALFKGFEAALELLKKIHESKGEVIDNPPIFVKRKLQTV